MHSSVRIQVPVSVLIYIGRLWIGNEFVTYNSIDYSVWHRVVIVRVGELVFLNVLKMTWRFGSLIVLCNTPYFSSAWRSLWIMCKVICMCVHIWFFCCTIFRQCVSLFLEPCSMLCNVSIPVSYPSQYFRRCLLFMRNISFIIIRIRAEKWKHFPIGNVLKAIFTSFSILEKTICLPVRTCCWKV